MLIYDYKTTQDNIQWQNSQKSVFIKTASPINYPKSKFYYIFITKLLNRDKMLSISYAFPGAFEMFKNIFVIEKNFKQTWGIIVLHFDLF